MLAGAGARKVASRIPQAAGRRPRSVDRPAPATADQQRARRAALVPCRPGRPAASGATACPEICAPRDRFRPASPTRLQRELCRFPASMSSPDDFAVVYRDSATSYGPTVPVAIEKPITTCRTPKASARMANIRHVWVKNILLSFRLDGRRVDPNERLVLAADIPVDTLAVAKFWISGTHDAISLLLGCSDHALGYCPLPKSRCHRAVECADAVPAQISAPVLGHVYVSVEYQQVLRRKVVQRARCPH